MMTTARTTKDDKAAAMILYPQLKFLHPLRLYRSTSLLLLAGHRTEPP